MQPWQMTTVCACEKTVVMVKQPGHLTSMKKERGAGTRVYVTIRLARADGHVANLYGTGDSSIVRLFSRSGGWRYVDNGGW